MTTSESGAGFGGEFRSYLLAESREYAQQLIERFQAEIPAYANIDAAAVSDSVRQAMERVVQVVLDRGRLEPLDLAGFREYGALRARQGIPLEAVLRGWQIGVRMSIDRAVAAGRAGGVGDALLMDFTTDVLTVTDDATLAFSAGHRDAGAVLDRQDGLRRTELVRRLLFSDAATDDIRLEAQRYGLAIDRDYLTVRIRPLGGDSVFALGEELQRQPSCRPPNGLLSVIDDDVLGVCATVPAVGGRVVGGIGPAAPIGDHARSLRLATRAVATAQAFGLSGVHRFPGLGLLPAVLADADVGEAMSELLIALVGDGESAAAILDTVDRYLESGMHVGATAKLMSVHHNTIRYRIARFEELTGTSLRDPHIALQAWWALRRRASGA
ncbi:PucR family transcriptional regulator [Nocardia sp. NPDC020380]|uniref:PucR family transcriptional regulator n=1 Tax=Nocardia sp. NPDC020380 TaxID=3364309 RepID=UPI00378FD42A